MTLHELDSSSDIQFLSITISNGCCASVFLAIAVRNGCCAFTMGFIQS